MAKPDRSDANNAAETPLEAKVTIEKMNLAASGFIDPAAGISGIADYDGTVTSDGHQAKTQGKLTATNLQLVKKGSPAGKPVTGDLHGDARSRQTDRHHPAV